MPVLQPRNSKQVKIIRSKQLQKQHLSHDALYIWYAFAATKSCLMSWIKCFWYSPRYLSCCDVIWHNYSTRWFLCINTCFPTHSVQGSLCCLSYTRKNVAGMPWWAVWHLLQACACSEENKEAHSYWWGTGLRKQYWSVPTSSSSPLRCWNHVLRYAKRWLQSHGAPAHPSDAGTMC